MVPSGHRSHAWLITDVFCGHAFNAHSVTLEAVVSPPAAIVPWPSHGTHAYPVAFVPKTR